MTGDRDEDERSRAVHLGVGMSPPMRAAVWFSVGLGAAYWWWSKLAQGALQSSTLSVLPAPLGKSPETARSSWAGQSGEAPVEVGAPELIMAHAPAPADAPDHPAHPSDRQIAEPPPEMLAHTPPESVGVSFKPRSGFENPTHDPESVFRHVEAGRPDAEGGGEAADGPKPKSRPNASSGSASAQSAAILASPPGEPVYDLEALATETSVATLTDGEALDQTAAPLQAIGEASPAPATKPRLRRKPDPEARPSDTLD